jgi:uncharacterized protein
MKSSVEIVNILRKLKPTLESKFHVARIGYFSTLTPDPNNPEHDIDLLVKFSTPVGWKFFELEEFLEKKLQRRIDVTTEYGIHRDLREHVLKNVHYL